MVLFDFTTVGSITKTKLTLASDLKQYTIPFQIIGLCHF